MSGDRTRKEFERREVLEFVGALGLLSLAAPIRARAASSSKKQYGPGASDTEIKIGNIMPYSGPVSAYAAIGKIEDAYFKMINDQGGVNGRKISFISYDDAYSPPKTFEQARKLVEDDNVLLVFNSLGTPTNSAIHSYMNQKKVPQLFVATGATKWNDPKHFPWTMGWQPSYQAEGRIYAKYILKEKPNGKIAILYQDDDYGKDYVKGLKDGLGSKAGAMVVGEQAYQTTEPVVDSEVVRLQATEADVFFNVATPKFAAQAIVKVSDIGWKPLHILNNVSASIGSVLKPAGFDHAQGIVSAAYMKDPTDAQWKSAPDMVAWNSFMDKHMPGSDKTDANFVYGYSVARTMIQVLQQCGDDLTRENIMAQAAHLTNYEPGLLLPGIAINTSPIDFAPIEQLQLMKFEGQSWQLFGDVMSGQLEG
ncbi:ABC transporter substrate-binding protein [Bradyrhizobium canariense]|uniref:ABC transporter substrate-binding protein n=1 Tax=Bradyrhizobium canariense TaxID=255045 RepID=UPI000A19115D|nr:branched-chain amino acid ABC transporter substrate-binding protein [Bradyrhizobium canariense]OSI34332.1 branched-chain amino acid ABC transporter substrate-binding protein [Bradyrhizobium canariense]OSI45763.1 branched-chain amino acid ABC transporter substrate-binding protein [Bradyrhizobium canariense]OSI48674.1 branched-chain amino acid ABC transporter substrate-binding protein [Bradyrhizobium canariense]OSI53669.1 branched-chain amino acid ABC transporter substrate-binding protein [Bra